MRKLVYVTHPFGGNFDRLRDMRGVMRKLADVGLQYILFWAPWVDVCTCLVDTPENRSRGLEFDRHAIKVSHGLLEIVHGKPSSGQLTERGWAEALGIPIVTAHGYYDLERAAVAIANELGVT